MPPRRWRCRTIPFQQITADQDVAVDGRQDGDLVVMDNERAAVVGLEPHRHRSNLRG
jgi:hypothetical protein